MGGYLLALATVRLLVIGTGAPVTFDDSMSFAFAVTVPASIAFMYFMAIFTYGLEGDLGARQSMYPERLFTRPVTTAALAGWPMLYGTAAMATLWLAVRLFAVWPSGFDPPSVWPALLAGAILAWTQALTWMPYALPGVRVIVAVLLLVMIDVVVILAYHLEASEGIMVALLAPHLPVAYLVARFAVARARRGDVPDWRSRTWPGSGGSEISSCGDENISLRPITPRCGSSGGATVARFRPWWASCCRSSWPCFSSSATRRPSSARRSSRYC